MNLNFIKLRFLYYHCALCVSLRITTKHTLSCKMGATNAALGFSRPTDQFCSVGWCETVVLVRLLPAVVRGGLGLQAARGAGDIRH